jgi:hypothetical protein
VNTATRRRRAARPGAGGIAGQGHRGHAVAAPARTHGHSPGWHVREVRTYSASWRLAARWGAFVHGHE